MPTLSIWRRRISDENAYVISGTLGTARQTFFGTYTGDTIDAKAGPRIDGKDLKTDASRYFAGRLFYEGARRSEVVADANRYYHGHIRIVGENLGAM